jgi:lipid-A-disaccharide synthase
MTAADAPQRAGGAAGPLIFLVAGEPSGDALGGALMAALKRRTAGEVRFAGVGGAAMIGEGLEPLFPMSDLSVMGLVEVVPRLPRLIGRVRATVRAIASLRPDAVVTIDAPAFAAAIWRRLPADRPKLIHYVAPTVWAWRPGRARSYARDIDHLLTLFPFEPPYFENEGLSATFVGHPIVEAGIGRADGLAFRRRHGVAEDAPVLCFLPGSRAGELARLLPPFGEAVVRLERKFPELRTLAVAATPRLAEAIRGAGASWRSAPIVVVGEEKYNAMAASTVALAASGTVTLELALAGVPMVVGYRVNPLTALLARRLIKVSHVCLVNLLAGRGVVPELLQDDCRGDALAEAVGRLLVDEAARGAQVAAAGEAVRRLNPPANGPSGNAADVILAVVGRAAHNPAQREPGADTCQSLPTLGASASSTR